MIHGQPATASLLVVMVALATGCAHAGAATVFSVILERRGKRWVIVHDHTSADR